MIQVSHLPASGRAKRLRGLVSSRVRKNFRFIAKARPVAALLLFGAAAALLTMTGVNRTFAAASAGCQGGGFTLLGLSGNQRSAVPAGSVPSSFLVKGKYVEFTVDAATFGVRDWTLTGVPNPLDITGGRRTVVFASKIPDHRGIVLNGDIQIDSSGGSLVITRTGPGVTMKIQAKDCANGGVFQMEVERGDNTATVFTHVLGDGVFYFDNPNVRDRLGEKLPCSGILADGTPVICNGANPDGTVTVTARVNFANDRSSNFVGRDSSQVATRISNSCPNNIPNPTHPGSVNHCGGISQWSVASGGRMGQVMGEDSTEIAPAATVCTANCTAQNRVNGRAVVVGFPFPVPDPVRLQPRFPQLSNGRLAAITVSPSSVQGGTTAQGTVSLDAGAPAGGVQVQLSSSNSNVTTLPATTTIPAGFVESSFNITTKQVLSQTVATLRGSAGGATRNVGLTVTPQATPAADSVSVTRAEFDSSKRQLNVEATSTNASATLTVFVTSTNAKIGTLTGDGSGRFRGLFNVATNPGTITVKSSAGGSAARGVALK
jgi:hypothetical protein